MRIAIVFLVIILNIWLHVRDLEPSDNWNQVFSEPTPMEVFMDMVARLESTNNPRATNRFGMLGLYQFSPTTIQYLGFDVSREEFLGNRALQDSVMVAYIEYNHHRLENLIDQFEGTERNGVILSRATILAGAHFAGTNGMRSFLVNGQTDGRRDGNGMTVHRYISHFEDLNMPTI